MPLDKPRYYGRDSEDDTPDTCMLPSVRDVWASLREFWLKVIRHFYVLVVGVIGVASGVYGDFQAAGASPLVPLWVWLPLFAVGYGAAVIWAFHDVRMERDAVQRHATKAETDLEGARTKLADAQRERDEARRELKEARRELKEARRAAMGLSSDTSPGTDKSSGS